MGIIDFFGKVIKPIKMKNTGQLNPAPTQIVDEHVSCIRQLDVNLWFYRKGDDVVAFDAGYDHFPSIAKEFQRIDLDPKTIEAVFITHADMDHAGGIADGVEPIFPKAKVYLHEEEIGMLNGETKRFVKGPFRFSNPLRRSSEVTTLKDGEIVKIGEISVELIHIPGHTKGHSCYLVDDEVLISGDCMAFNQHGGFAFFKLYNMNHEENLASIQLLKSRFEGNPPRMICSGHSGYSTDQANYFRHIDQVAFGTKKKPFDPSAPVSVFDD